MAERLRKINLIEVLSDQAEAAGHSVDEPEDLADRSEADIRAFFASLTAAAATSHPAAFPPPDEATFRKWFPGLQLSGTGCATPRLRLLCFASAGNAEDLYTSEGTGARRAPSPLLEWCRAHSAECLAVQLPGRNLRQAEPPLGSCQEVATALLPVVASRLAATPWVAVAHSVGCWNAFEFLQAARAAGLPPPAHAFLSAMPPPDLAAEQRPWRPQHLLSDAEFQEECLGWDVNPVVFTPAMWPAYQPLMRADFTLFDQYRFQHQGAQPFSFPLTTFWGSQDRRVSQQMVAGWQRFTTGRFRCLRVEGHHLWPLQPGPKAAWLQQIVAELPPIDP